MTTESVNPATVGISNAPISEILTMINHEDATVASAVEKCIPQITKLVECGVNTLKGGGRIFYCGCGTSGRLAVVDASECPPTYGVSPELVNAVIAGGEGAMVHAAEGCEDSRDGGIETFKNVGCNKNDMVIGISAAGRAPFVLAFMEEAKRLGCEVGAIVNNSSTPMASVADISIEVLTGAEVIKGSTRMKAGTAQKMILNMFSTTLFIKMGCTYSNYMINMKPTNTKLRARAVSMVSEILHTDIENAKKRLEVCEWNIREALKGE